MREEEKAHVRPVSAAKECELSNWRDFELFQPKKERTPSKAIVDARMAPTWKMVDGEKDAKARLVAKDKQGPGSGGWSS